MCKQNIKKEGIFVQAMLLLFSKLLVELKKEYAIFFSLCILSLKKLILIIFSTLKVGRRIFCVIAYIRYLNLRYDIYDITFYDAIYRDIDISSHH